MVSYKALNTTIESTFADWGDGVRDGNRGQACAIPESRTTDCGDGVGDGHWGQTCATRESKLTDWGDGVGDGYWSQTCATIESIPTDRNCPLFNVDSCATCHFSFEFIRHFSYIDNSVRLVIIPRSAPESRPADFGDGVGDGHRGQAGTSMVFASCFVTSTYGLNGRKVMSRILEDS